MMIKMQKSKIEGKYINCPAYLVKTKFNSSRPDQALNLRAVEGNR